MSLEDSKIMVTKSFTDKNRTEHNFAKVKGNFGFFWAFLDEDGDWMFPAFTNEAAILQEIDNIANG